MNNFKDIKYETRESRRERSWLYATGTRPERKVGSDRQTSRGGAGRVVQINLPADCAGQTSMYVVASAQTDSSIRIGAIRAGGLTLKDLWFGFTAQSQTCGNRANGIAARRPQRERRRQINKTMKIKVKTKQDATLAEGTYNARVSSVTPKPTEAQPTKVLFGFRVDGYEVEIHKENPASFNAGSPLRADTETVLGRNLTADEDKHGFELNTLIDKQCQVVVFHKSGSGGRLKPTVSLVLSAAV